MIRVSFILHIYPRIWPRVKIWQQLHFSYILHQKCFPFYIWIYFSAYLYVPHWDLSGHIYFCISVNNIYDYRSWNVWKMGVFSIFSNCISFNLSLLNEKYCIEMTLLMLILHNVCYCETYVVFFFISFFFMKYDNFSIWQILHVLNVYVFLHHVGKK